MFEYRVQTLQGLFRYLPFINRIVLDGHETRLRSCEVVLETAGAEGSSGAAGAADTAGVQMVTFFDNHGPVLKVENWQAATLVLTLRYKRRYLPYLVAQVRPNPEGLLPRPLARSM